ncbi:hypothetical protein CC80DRAFT_255833 [Byssothecium circinans]|uniref:Uncharacterized protein n=1 Tax=Byssothecium circinans TaxID=147558 RepID=A0A6A5TCZ1_9PLEO|nr:hypothetical protein CC80DRAFT_255833 [Byssothecium circinans]
MICCMEETLASVLRANDWLERSHAHHVSSGMCCSCFSLATGQCSRAARKKKSLSTFSNLLYHRLSPLGSPFSERGAVRFHFASRAWGINIFTATVPSRPGLKDGTKTALLLAVTSLQSPSSSPFEGFGFWRATPVFGATQRCGVMPLDQ